ncbi:hypothetical protein D3C87_715880 [compost metagenome]
MVVPCAPLPANTVALVALAPSLALTSVVTGVFTKVLMLSVTPTGLTEMMKVCDALWFTPPFAVPPLSFNTTVTVTLPVKLAAGV